MELGVSKTSSTMFSRDQELWEYLLVAQPDAFVDKKIEEIKQSFYNVYKHNIEVDSEPNISILSFQATESMEETLIRWIHRICSQLKSFRVSLNNYSGFPPHTIYLRVQNHEPFQQLACQLKVIDQYIQSNGCPEARFHNRPYLTIAGLLDKNVYHEAMLNYSQETFHETFQLTELVLLKRSNQFDRCKQVNIFHFYPPDTNRYTEVA